MENRPFTQRYTFLVDVNIPPERNGPISRTVYGKIKYLDESEIQEERHFVSIEEISNEIDLLLQKIFNQE